MGAESRVYGYLFPASSSWLARDLATVATFLRAAGVPGQSMLCQTCQLFSKPPILLLTYRRPWVIGVVLGGPLGPSANREVSVHPAGACLCWPDQVGGISSAGLPIAFEVLGLDADKGWASRPLLPAGTMPGMEVWPRRAPLSCQRLLGLDP